VITVALLATAAAFLLAITQTKQYSASARLMYVQPANISNPTDTNSSIDLNTLNLQLQSIGNTIGTPVVEQRAERTMSAHDRGLNYSVDAKILAPASTTSGSAIADTVEVTVLATDPAAAARIANAYSGAVIALRKESEQASDAAAQQVIQGQLDLFKTNASRLTTDYANLVVLLRNLQIAQATATGDFQLVLPATTPGAPAAPHPTRSGALGLGIGLVAGVGLAFVVGQFDTRVRTHREVAEILRMPIIGRVPQLRRRIAQDNTGLLAMTEPHGGMSEALRMLRSNLDWAGIDHGLCSLIVTSCSKGEGKTLTVCNLAVTLARAGKRVVVVDADLRAPRVHSVFGLPNVTGLTSVLLGTTPFDRAAQRFPQARMSTSATAADAQWEGSLLVLTAGPLPPNPGEVIASRRFASWLTEMSDSDADYVLVDAPPILGVGDVGAMAASADALLMIVDIEQARRPLLEDGREILESLPCRKVGVVTVREHVDDVSYHYSDR